MPPQPDTASAPGRKPRRVTARVQVAPGEWEEVTFPAAAFSRWGLVRLKHDPKTGAITQELQTWTGMYRLTEKPERDLGLPFHWQWYIVYGYLAKFFKVRRVGTVTLIDVHSLYEFLEECQDPEFWTPERVERRLDARRDYNGKLHQVMMPVRGRRKKDPRPVEERGSAAVRECGSAGVQAPAVIRMKRGHQDPNQLEMFDV